MKFKWLVFMFLGLSGCGSQIPNAYLNKTNAIIGGVKVQDSDPISKLVVALYNTEEQYSCSGTLISEDTVLTAAHCVDDKPQNMVVSFGLVMDLNKGITRQVVSELAHPEYKDESETDQSHDIALVRFEGGLPEGYQSAGLVTRELGKEVVSGTTVTLAGFGLDKNWFGSILGKSGRLRKVDIKLKKPIYTDTEVEVDGWTKGTCSGDSGGPGLVKFGDRYYVWSITSRGGGWGKFAKCVHTSIYTRVDAYTEWINKSLVTR